MDDRIVWLASGAIFGFYIIASLAFVYWIDIKKPQKYGINKYSIRAVNPAYLSYLFSLVCLNLYFVLVFLVCISSAMNGDPITYSGGQIESLKADLYFSILLAAPMICRITIASWIESFLSKTKKSSTSD